MKTIRAFLKRYTIFQLLLNGTIVFSRYLTSCVAGLFPMKCSCVLLQAYEGRQFSCNPKYIANYLISNSRLNVVLSLKNPDKYSHLKELGFNLVKSGSLKYYYYYMTSKVLICNDFLPLFIGNRMGQVTINTWHGGGAYKKVGISLSKNKYYTQRYLWQHRVNYMISSCKEFSKLASEAFQISEYNMLPIGMPRNDILVHSKSKEEITNKVKKAYSIPVDKKIVLYAPTYRESFKNSLYGLDFETVLVTLKEKFGGEWIFFFRGHYFLVDSSQIKDDSFINVSDYDDMQELLCAADCLITDYSSSVWDFSLTFKPCFLYATDLDEYKKEIDFYYPIERWPFPLAQNNQELFHNILNYDALNYHKAVEEHQRILGSYENGHACEKIGKIIIELCK